jgi:hypothetical protein
MSEFRWMMQASCLDVIDPMWDENLPSRDALRFCFRCPVRRDCAEYGLGRNYASDAGVLGGLSIYDRERIRDGQVTLVQVWRVRLEELVQADWDDALAEAFRMEMAYV